MLPASILFLGCFFVYRAVSPVPRSFEHEFEIDVRHSAAQGNEGLVTLFAVDREALSSDCCDTILCKRYLIHATRAYTALYEGLDSALPVPVRTYTELTYYCVQ
jgi:hypothetical protein